ncbi:CoA-transferase subunit beta [Calderihabitans maritimus]|uniref:3-oxoacid CoA-transferase n=1 Tax=Calderihabitans maritimus TaxID=1246530 RepID=A0A1Z5HTS7_9FIRM|nr:CoA-transferase [Calderihabitans maritimus]GAW92680.1 3-oxoacid CoA-transferase [Calderihabitans maritimus]
MVSCNRRELLAVVASRYLEDNHIVFAGTGLPLLAVMLAKRLRAPNLTLVFEAGGIAPALPMLPLSVGDSRTTYRAIRTASMSEVMEMAQQGLITYALLSAAQIDVYGNVNSTILGRSYIQPELRLPGSGGANEMMSLCWKSWIIMEHDRKRFVDRVDFISSPGYLRGPGWREKAGLPAETGPELVFTDLGIFDFEPESKRMRLRATMPGVTVEKIMDQTGFSLIIPVSLREEPPPAEEELRVLREEVDPWRVLLEPDNFLSRVKKKVQGGETWVC